MRVAILSESFDPLQEISCHQKQLPLGAHGACVIFTGDMRTQNENRNVNKLYLEHYPEMTDRHLHQIAETAQKRWEIVDLMLLHRIGDVQPGETIVLSVVWAAHRAEAFGAARFMIEDLKERAPFWKKEYTDDGAEWVSGNTPPSADAAAWMKNHHD